MTTEQKSRVQKWVDALRSGKYLQATGQLRVGDNGWCCLGVACDVYMKENSDLRWSDYDSYDAAPGVVQTHAASMPSKVADWFGFADHNPRIPRLQHSLAGLNDSGHSFNYIADEIEKEWVKGKEVV